MINNICSVITVYYPDVDRLNEVIQSIEVQSKLIIIFNSPVSEEIKIPSAAKVIVNDKNLGIAKALNQACFLAKESDFDYVFILDQDSIPASNAIKVLSSIVQKEDRALLGLEVKEDFKNEQISTPLENKSIIETDFVISSGSLINLQVLSNLGYFREDFFIDCVDHEYCLRLKENGLTIYKTTLTFINHQLGKPTQIENPISVRYFISSILFRDYKKRMNYPPSRIYYQFRNEIWMKKIYGRDLYRNPSVLLKMFTRQLLLEKVDKDKVIAMFKGIRDGILIDPENY